jgi:CBS domain containing-hemolysin-like protein
VEDPALSVAFALSLFWMAVSLLFSLAQFSLRDFSGVSFERIMRRRGREALLNRFFVLEEDLLTITMSVRQLANLLFVLTVAHQFELFGWPPEATGWRWAAAGGIAFGAVTLFSNAIPRACAHYRGARILAAMLPLLLAIRVVLMPLVWLVRGIDEVVRRLAGIPEPETPDEKIADELMSVVTEGAREGTLDDEQRQMLEGVIEFHSTDAGAIMTPRTEVVGIEVGATLEAVRRAFAESGHSRLPVYEGTLDAIIGVLHARDMLSACGQTAGGPFDLRKVMRQAVFVPEMITLPNLLDTFQKHRIHIGVVLDEYGGTSGIVTIEDLLKEIVGDIHDEHGPRLAEGLVRLGPSIVEASGRTRIAEINDALDVSLPEDEEYDTIAGLVFSQLGRIPKKDEHVTAGEVRITVLDAGPRRIRRLRVERAADEQDGRL